MATTPSIKRQGKKRSTTTPKEVSTIESEMAVNFSYNFKIKKPFHFNSNHQDFYDCIKDDETRMVFVDGPAGSAKTYIGTLAALELFKDKKCKQIIYIRSAVESASRSLGSLPGEIDEKFGPYAMPLIEKVTELTDATTAAHLKAGNVLAAIPVNYCRGLTFMDSVVIVDEVQNMTISEITTILTRFGKNCKYVICGDSLQCDIRYGCINKLYDAFDTPDSRNNNIYVFEFGEEDIVRSKILKFITKTLETIPRDY